MRSALYYPRTTVENEDVVKTALLLWDKLEFIVPWEGFHSNRPRRTRLPPHAINAVARAMELVGSPHCPSQNEKEAVHKHVEDLIKRPLPPTFYRSRGRLNHDDDYELFPQKLLRHTWRSLAMSKLSGAMRPNADIRMTEPAGLTIMSILADCCAGKTRARITDRGDAYATLAGILGDDSGEINTRPKTAEEQLVPISLKIVDTSRIDLTKLIEFREREELAGGHTIRDLRHRYVDGLEKYIHQLTTVKGNAADAEAIKRQFADDMEIDLKHLKDELGFARRDAILSKDVLVTALATIGTIATSMFGISVPILGVITMSGAPATIGGLLGTGNKYLSTRRAILQKHPMAYLYELPR